VVVSSPNAPAPRSPVRIADLERQPMVMFPHG